jgi:3D-(3,5/4)-trihydroxycyclohexane-1,2-dione acylhydrolase (decyclizing)
MWFLCAAGSLPGDLHKLWRTRDPKGYHLEYGLLLLWAYEIAGGSGGEKWRHRSGEVLCPWWEMVSYLMLAQEIITSIQEGYKLTIVLINNQGFWQHWGFCLNPLAVSVLVPNTATVTRKPKP